MSDDLVTVTPTATVAEAAQVMSLRRVGAALVVDDDQLLGIFTERDIRSADDPPQKPARESVLSIAFAASFSAWWTARKMSATCSGFAVAAAPLEAIAVMSHALSNTCQSVSRDIGPPRSFRLVLRLGAMRLVGLGPQASPSGSGRCRDRRSAFVD